MSSEADRRPPWALGGPLQGLTPPPAAASGAGPDAAGHVERDDAPLVLVEIETTPPVVAPGEAARVRLELRPDASKEAHWNNEAGDTQLWLDAPAGWRLDESLHSVPNPPEDVSSEPRAFEVELRAPEGIEGAATLRGYALYFVCEDVTGVCMFRRQDIEVPLEAREP